MSSLRISFLMSCVCVLSTLGCNQAADESAAPTEPTAAALEEAKPAQAAPEEAAKPAEAPAEPQPTAAPEAPAAKVAADSPCAAICARSTELKCTHARECEAMCAESMADAPCLPQMKAATDCMLKQPAKSWECTEEGVAAIKQGFCDAEQGAFVDCMSKQAPR